MFEVISTIKAKARRLSASSIVKIFLLLIPLISLPILVSLVRHTQDMRRSAQELQKQASGTTSFTYDGEGQRLSKTTSDGTTWYPNALMEVVKDNTGKVTRVVRNYYFGGKLVSVREISSVTPTPPPSPTPTTPLQHFVECDGECRGDADCIPTPYSYSKMVCYYIPTGTTLCRNADCPDDPTCTCITPTTTPTP